MMFETLSGCSSAPPVSTWNRVTITRSATKIPICRSLLVRKENPSLTVGGVVATTGSLTVVAMESVLFLGHVLHEEFRGRLPDGHFRGDAAFGEGVDAVTDAEELGKLRGDDDDGLPLGSQPVDDRVDLVLRADVDAAGGLVEDQDIGVR